MSPRYLTFLPHGSTPVFVPLSIYFFQPRDVISSEALLGICYWGLEQKSRVTYNETALSGQLQWAGQKRQVWAASVAHHTCLILSLPVEIGCILGALHHSYAPCEWRSRLGPVWYKLPLLVGLALPVLSLGFYSVLGQLLVVMLSPLYKCARLWPCHLEDLLKQRGQ